MQKQINHSDTDSVLYPRVHIVRHSFATGDGSSEPGGLFPDSEILGVYRSVSDARQRIADEINLILQYGLGDGYVAPGDGQVIRLSDPKSILGDGGHNPHLLFCGDDITVGVCEDEDDDEEPRFEAAFRRFEIMIFSAGKPTNSFVG